MADDQANHGSILDTSYDVFAKSTLSLYSGPQVVIRIGSGGQEYRLPKALLCKQSPYFAAMFAEGRFKEGGELSATLEEIEGVLSIKSFEMLLQWIWLGRITFGDPGATPAAEQIALAVEFSRLADMYLVTGVEDLMAETIRKEIVADGDAQDSWEGDHGVNTYCITGEHLVSTANLPCGHPVRGFLASAMVEDFFLVDDYRFKKEMAEIPGFATDVLDAVKQATRTLVVVKNKQTDDCAPEIEDPITGRSLRLE